MTTEEQDIVARLQSTDAHDTPSAAGYLMIDAAAEIERLRGELAERNERLLVVYEALTGQHRDTWPAAVGSGT